MWVAARQALRSAPRWVASSGCVLHRSACSTGAGGAPALLGCQRSAAPPANLRHHVRALCCHSTLQAEARLFLQQKQALALAGAVCGPPQAEAAAQQQRQQEQRTRLRQPGPAAPASAQPQGCGAGWARGGPQALQGSVLPPVNVSAALAALGSAAPWLRHEQSAAPQPPAGPAGQQAQQRLERRRRRQRQRGGEDDEWRLWLELSISQSSWGSGSALTSAGVPQREVQRTPTSSRLPLPLPAQQVLLPQQQAPTGAGLLGGAPAVATLPAGLFFPQMQPGWQAGAAAGAHQACACGPGATAPAPPPAAAPALEQQARAQQPSTSRTFSQELSSLLGLLQQGEGGAAGAPAAPGPAPGVQPGWMPERCAAAPGTGQATGGQEPGRAGPLQQGMEVRPDISST